MRTLLSATAAARIMVILFVASIVLHGLVLLRVIPYTIVGGGRITKENMYLMEAIAIVMNMILLFIVLMWRGDLPRWSPTKLFRPLFWAMFVLFTLNTIGNLFAITWTETLIFTPLTLILAVCSLRLAIER